MRHFPEYIVMCAKNPSAFEVYRDLEEACRAARNLATETGAQYAVYTLASVYNRENRIQT